MLYHWHREIENLKAEILKLGILVEEQIQKAITALDKQDLELAKEVIRSDKRIDEFEIHIEEECLKILALYQPVARELRFVVTVLKMNNDLERMGDLAANIARHAKFLSKQGKIDLIAEFALISTKVQAMVRKVLESLVNTDMYQAREVISADDEIDRLTNQLLKKTIKATEQNCHYVKEYFSIRSISKNLERIADSATNIAEDVIYLCSGEIVRHQEEFSGDDRTEE
ncbi:MAG: phosphate signaling complex protein PhoU [Ignavibacteria bacterium]